LAAGKTFEHSPEKSATTFVYVIDGSGYVESVSVESQHCVLFSDGDTVEVKTKSGVRFLFVSGAPLGEPIAWGGPIVMNTEEELAKAFAELDEGNFIKDSRIVRSTKDFYKG
jgi:redox-sensitive bicupin YhaK (pirin superfamily)